MDARLMVLTTYQLLNNTRYFRLRLCAKPLYVRRCPTEIEQLQKLAAK